MKYRKKLKYKSSKKLFRKTSGTKRKNYSFGRVMRGGTRM